MAAYFKELMRQRHGNRISQTEQRHDPHAPFAGRPANSSPVSARSGSTGLEREFAHYSTHVQTPEIVTLQSIAPQQ
jgi:hypothetical protein